MRINSCGSCDLKTMIWRPLWLAYLFFIFVIYHTIGCSGACLKPEVLSMTKKSQSDKWNNIRTPILSFFSKNNSIWIILRTDDKCDYVCYIKNTEAWWLICCGRKRSDTQNEVFSFNSIDNIDYYSGNYKYHYHYTFLIEKTIFVYLFFLNLKSGVNIMDMLKRLIFQKNI